MSVDNPEDSIDENVHHYDFTTASSWEIFIARIEELIYQWKLSTGKRKKSVKGCEFSRLDWKVQTEEVSFADTRFSLTWHRGEGSDEDESSEVDTIDEAMNIERDFASAPHIIASYYGLSEFVILDPLHTTISHSKLNTLLSAITIAVTNSQCEVPFFVRALELRQNFYMGVACGPTLRTYFDMVDLKKIPQQCQHLTGLTHIFKSNLKKNSGKDMIVSVRMSYQLKNWTSNVWNRDPPDTDFSNFDSIDELFKLPIGCLYEPLSCLCVRAVWSGLPDGSIVDGPGYSDLDPRQAPRWTLSVGKVENIACLLTDYLLDFTHFCSFSGTSHELIGDLLARQNVSDYDKPLSSLTESHIPKLSDLLFSDSSIKKSVEEPIPRNFLLPILHYLFPDTEESKRYPYSQNAESNPENQKYKSCRENSLVWRLSLATAHVLHSLGGPRSATHLWHEFAQELRFRWNSATLIPGVAPGLPDSKTCLLHQKLQMINCCIDRKLEREKAITNLPDSDESEEEFYDAESEDYEGKVSLWNLPAGRQEKHPILRLLVSGNPLYIPKTQPPVPKTEDQLEEDAQALLSLGPSSQASLLRAKLMSASLLSDMESFKAANPGTVIEDFIRWYSPWDWIEKEDENGVKTGELSARMVVEGNLWVEVWGAAKPVPAHRQKRLFDETREAERALHLVESAGPAEAASLLLPVLLHAALNALSSQIYPTKLSTLIQALDRIIRKAHNRTRPNYIDIGAYQDLVTEIGTLECVLSQVISLEHKFGVKCCSEEGQFIGDLVTTPEVEVPGGPNGVIATKIKAMFSESYRVEQMLEREVEDERLDDFTQVMRPDTKEFILRIKDGGIAQKLSAALSQNRITMASLSTQPTLLC